MKYRQFSTIAAALSIFTLISISGCGGTTAGNPLVTLQFGNYTARNQLLEILIPSAFAATSNIKMCFKRLRFKTDIDPSGTAEDNVDLRLGEVTLNSSSSTPLGQLVVPANTYRRIEFDLAPNGTGCSSGSSISFSNANGTYSSNDTITISFNGTFVAAGAEQTVTMGVQALIDALNSVSGPAGNNGSIRNVLQSAGATGNF